jgi:hypothetical protein
VDLKVLTLDPSSCRQPFAERSETELHFWVAFGKRHQSPKASYSFWLLRPRRQRPPRRTSEPPISISQPTMTGNFF